MDQIIQFINLHVTFPQLSEGKNREEQLRQQMAEKEDKTKKVVVAAKTKINQLNSAKEKLSQEMEELKQSKEELEVRMNALKSQYEGRLLRMDRELRELREIQVHSEPKEEPQESSGAKVADQPRSSDQRHVSLKSPVQDRGSSSLSDPPTANIRPTPGTPSPSNKPSPAQGSKATPRASIRPMVTPAAVSVPTPTATVMPTTQTDSQEALTSVGASLHSTGSILANPAIPLSQSNSTQATAFVQPTQQQAANQDTESSMDAEQPSTSGSQAETAGSKRVREEEEEEEEERQESSHTHPFVKKLRIKPAPELQMEEVDEEMEGELRNERESEGSADDNQEFPEQGFPILPGDEDTEEDVVSQSVPLDQTSSQVRDVIVIDTDSESRESKEGEEKQEEDCEEEDDEDGDEEEYKEEDDDENEDDAGDSREAGQDNGEEENRDAEENGGGQDPSGAPEPETSVSGASSDSQRANDSSNSATLDPDPQRETLHLPPTPTSSVLSPSSLTPRLHHPRRPLHHLPPRLYIQPPAAELGPPHTQRQSSQLRRPSVGRQLTPGIGSMQHFFDDDDRMVPSTPTLVVPHRTDGFAEAIHSPQVGGLSTRFRFGPPEDLLPQASGSHSDLGQLASQGGLGMYESPLLFTAHDDDGGGRSVPTTPLQVAAPVTVFSESMPSDGGDNMASQSVPMVTASTGMASAADDGDEVFMEQERESPGIESSLESHTDMESTGQQSDDASLPSTSQEPDITGVPQRRMVSNQPLISSLSSRGTRGGRGEVRMLLSRRGPLSRGGRGAAFGRGGVL